MGEQNILTLESTGRQWKFKSTRSVAEAVGRSFEQVDLLELRVDGVKITASLQHQPELDSLQPNSHHYPGWASNQGTLMTV